MNDLMKRMAIVKLAEHRSVPSDAYIAGFCKVAEAHGVDPCELIKAAWTWGDVFAAPINTVVGAGNSLWSGVTGNGFGNGWRNGYNAADTFQKAVGDSLVDGDSWRTFGKNLSTGAAAMVTGIGQGLAATPGMVGGLVGGVGSLVTGNGWGNGWDKGRDFVDSIGVGDYNLGTLKTNLADFQRFNRDVYVDTNNIDLNNLSALERAGLYSLDTAAAAGRMIGETAGFAGAGKVLSGAGKVVSNAAGKIMPRAAGGTGAAGAAGATGAAASTAGTAARTAANTAGTAANTARTAAGTAANTAANTAAGAAGSTGAAAGRMASIANKAKTVAQNVNNSNAVKAVKTWGGRAVKGGLGVAMPIAEGVASAKNYINGTRDFMNTKVHGSNPRSRNVDISTML